MAKLKISDYSSTSAGANLNTDINSIDIDEGCAPSGINNAIRTLMAQLKDFQTGVSGDSLTLGGALSGTSATFSGNVTASAISGASLTLSGNITASAISGASMTLSGDLTVDTNTLYVDSTNNRVGIGTSSPNERLHIANTGNTGTSADNVDVEISSTNRNSAIYLNANGSHSSSIIMENAGTEKGRIIYNMTSNYMAFQTNGTTERMRIDSNGNFQIGSSAVASNTLRYFDLYNTDTGASAGSIIRLITNNVANTAATTVDLVKYRSGGFIIANNETNAAAYTGFNVGASERMRIDSSGNLLVGTTSASGARITTLLATSQVGYYQNKPSTGNADHQQFYTDGTLFAKMTNRGSWYNFDNVYGALSDETLKENIQDATFKLDDLMQVKVRNYNFIADDSKTKQLGVIAQEVEQIFPSMVDVDDDGLKSVKYSVFVPMCIKAIQELKTENDTLKSQLSALETRIQALENK